MQQFGEPIVEHAAHVDDFKNYIDELDFKLDDVRTRSEDAQKIAQLASSLNSALPKGKLWAKVYTVNNLTADAEGALETAKSLLRNASVAVEDTRAATSEIR